MAKTCCKPLVVLVLLVISPALSYPQGDLPETRKQQKFTEPTFILRDETENEGDVAQLEDVLGAMEDDYIMEEKTADNQQMEGDYLMQDETVDNQQMEGDYVQDETVDNQQMEGNDDDAADNQQMKENEPHIEQRRCYNMLYVMAFTSGTRYAGSDNHPYLFLDLYTHEDGHVRFYNRPGDDMMRNKGDLWRYNIRSFRFKSRCITKEMVNKVAIHNGGNDGWKISAIMTVLRAGKYFTVLTADMELNRWIDADSKNIPHQITLTKV